MADFVGTSGPDTLTGTNNPDTLNGLGGADTMTGLDGDDIYFVDDSGDQVFETQNQGNDTVYASVSYALTTNSHVEFLSTISWAQTTAINLTGNSLGNTIYGNAGGNVLDGAGGADRLIGFGGNDVYFVDNVGDVIIESGGQGSDTVYASTSYQLNEGASVEVLSTISWVATTAINLTGNELANILYGNAGANSLDGGVGADIMVGFGGDDSYFVDNLGDAVVENAGQGFDTVYARASFALTAGAFVEILSTISWGATTAIDLTGNELGNIIYGNAGSNMLDGGAGADSLNGFGGDDTYFVDNAGDVVNEGLGLGFDTVYVRASYALTEGSYVETLSTISWGATTAIDLIGNSFANNIYGNAGANLLNGGAGSDTLVGFGGADIFAFTTALGAGNVDVISDFNVVDDTIQLGGAAGQPFAALATGALRSGTLVIGTVALDADDYLIYNSGTGALMYDADGNGAGAAVQIATLSTGLALTVADFLVSGVANNAPSITSGGTASVPENSPASTIVYQTQASDADGDRITYSLSGADSSLLTIDASGAVRLITSPNFEAKSSYTFNVIASDSGVSTLRVVTLTITDVAEGSTPIINETANPNNNFATAQSIDPGTFAIAANPNLPNDAYPSATIVGNIAALGDVDFFSITLQAGQQLILDVDNTSGGLDSFLTLYNPNQAFIGENDDLITLDPGSNPPFSHNTDSQIIFRASTSGTYFFKIESFNDDSGPTSTGGYQINVSINSAPVTPEQIMAEDVDALVSGASWNHTNLTYGFPQSAAVYPQSFEEVNPASQFEAFSATQMTATRALLQLIANVSVLTFAEQTGAGAYTVDGSAAEADLRFAESQAAEVAYAYYPTNGGAGSVGGSAWFNHDDFNAPFRGNYAWMGILHETGHALGLKHGHEFPLAISEDHDSVEYSVMTYRSYPQQDLADGGGYTNEQFGYPQTLMMLDIAALQKIYDGANYAFNSGASVYTWSSLTGEMSINGVGQGAPGANRVFMTIWDGGGNDTYDLSNYADNTTIDLRPGEWTTTSQIQIAGLGEGHFARGNIANALLFEGNINSAIENAIGGAGNNTLIANQVANLLTGNGGNDIFKWMSTSHAGIGGLADTVTDFVRGTDKIDFTNLDASPGTAGQQDFAFIGTGAFTSVAGQVRYDVTGGSAHIFADSDGNGVADMEIILTNIVTLAASDFNF